MAEDVFALMLWKSQAPAMREFFRVEKDLAARQCFGAGGAQRGIDANCGGRAKPEIDLTRLQHMQRGGRTHITRLCARSWRPCANCPCTPRNQSWPSFVRAVWSGRRAESR